MKLKAALLLLAAALGTAAIAEPARALTLTSTVANPTGFAPGSTVIGFDSPLPSGVSLAGGQIVSGTTPNVFAQPFGTNDPYLAVTGPTRTATLSLGRLSNYFGLYWGSVDRFNTLEFLRGGSVIASFTGQQIAAFAALPGNANGDQGPDGSVYVNFFADDSSELIDSVRFLSTRAAFEADNLAFQPIPTPALVPAAIGFGAAMLRKRRKSEQDAAGDNA